MTLFLKGGKNEPYHRGFFCNDDNIKYPMVSAISQFWFQALLRSTGGYLIKKIKTDEFSIKVPFSQTCRTLNISKNQNLYPQQSRITLFTLQ